MEKKKGKLYVITLFAVLAAASCELFSSEIGVTGMGKMLVPDEEGHFKEDLVYSLSGASYSFYANGEYLYEFFEWDSVTSDYVLDEGWSGTYSWNPETMVLTENQLKDYVQATETWEDLIETSERTMYFTTVNFGEAFVFREENSWEYETFVQKADGSYDTDSYLITLNSDTYIYKRMDLSYDSTGLLDSGWDGERECDISGLFPEGITWEQGNCVIFNLTETLDRDRNYDNLSSAWGTWDINSLNIFQIRFLNMGSFFCIPNSAAMRGLGVIDL